MNTLLSLEEAQKFFDSTIRPLQQARYIDQSDAQKAQEKLGEGQEIEETRRIREILHEFITLVVGFDGDQVSLDELLAIPDIEKTLAIFEEIRNSRGCEGEVRDITFLTGDIAAFFIPADFPGDRSWPFTKLTKMTLRAAQKLAEYPGGLEFGGLTTASAAVIEALSHHQGDSLQLKALQQISEESFITLLENYQGVSLSLKSVQDISDHAFESVAKFRGKVFAIGLKSLNEKRAESIVATQADVYLDVPYESLSAAVKQILDKKKGQIYLARNVNYKDKDSKN
jgi:hypothetical protein